VEDRDDNSLYKISKAVNFVCAMRLCKYLPLSTVWERARRIAADESSCVVKVWEGPWPSDGI